MVLWECSIVGLAQAVNIFLFLNDEAVIGLVPLSCFLGKKMQNITFYHIIFFVAFWYVWREKKTFRIASCNFNLQCVFVTEWASAILTIVKIVALCFFFFFFNPVSVCQVAFKTSLSVLGAATEKAKYLWAFTESPTFFCSFFCCFWQTFGCGCFLAARPLVTGMNTSARLRRCRLLESVFRVGRQEPLVSWSAALQTCANARQNSLASNLTFTALYANGPDGENWLPDIRSLSLYPADFKKGKRKMKKKKGQQGRGGWMKEEMLNSAPLTVICNRLNLKGTRGAQTSAKVNGPILRDTQICMSRRLVSPRDVSQLCSQIHCVSPLR